MTVVMRSKHVGELFGGAQEVPDELLLFAVHLPFSHGRDLVVGRYRVG